MRIHCDYAGGNIKVLSVDETTVKLEQDIRDSQEWWFYWNFCVEGAENKEIVFEFANGEVLGPWGPAFSNNGVTWHWAGSGSLLSRSSFKYQFSCHDKQVFFSFSIPYQVERFKNFCIKKDVSSLFDCSSLTVSEQGRTVDLIVFGNRNAKKDILLTCRHHACESTASYVLEGLLEYFLQNIDSPMLKGHTVHCIPFVDIDGVENGDQGKARRPHDHNRDYINEPIYKFTSAIMDYIKELNLAVALDFHSPWKWGGRNDYVFFVKRPSPIKEELEAYSKFLEYATVSIESEDKITYDSANDIDADVEWNSSNFPEFRTYCEKMGAKLCCSIEIPYFGVESAICTEKSLLRLGEGFAKSLESYLGL